MDEIKQGYMAACMEKFQWNRDFHLQEYRDKSAPLVMFGCYKPNDKQIALNHKGQVLIIWMGSDTWKIDALKLIKPNIIHATWIKNIQKYWLERGVACQLLKVPLKEPKPKPVRAGSKVYSYVQWNKPEFYGQDIIKRLDIKYDLLIGRHQIDQKQWYNGVRDQFYSQAFIGLVLSHYAGGAMTIQELGLRGLLAVTNVLDLPNCLPWQTKQDIEEYISYAAMTIGQRDKELSEKVYESLFKINGKIDDSIFDDKERAKSA